MKKIFKNLELIKFRLLVTKEEVIPVKQGNKLLYLLNTKTNKIYQPKLNRLVVA